MKDILQEKIELESKLKCLNLMHQYYAGRIKYDVYKDMLANLMANKKKLLVLVDDETDFTIRQKLESQAYPFSYYEKNIMGDTNNS